MLDYWRRKKLLIKFIIDRKKVLSDGLIKKIKGSLRDPSICLLSFFSKSKRLKQKTGLSPFCSRLIALFLFVFLASGLIALRSSGNRKDFCLISFSKIFAQSEKSSLFFASSDNFLPESPEFLLVQSSSLKPSSPPVTFSSQALGALVGGYSLEQETRKDILEHVVESGETLSSLAVEYGISLKTILWANDLTEKSAIKPGDTLVILPVSGVIHHVKSGDTISQIAEKYKGKTSEIVAFNQLSGEADIYIGDIVIVPNGTLPAPSEKSQPSSSAPAPAPVPAPSSASAPLGSSYFIVPVSSPYIITQRLHWYNAIDFSHQGNGCGKPVFAAAAGTVQRVNYGRTGYGYYLTILHPNNVVTLYAHLSEILVKPGATVSQGTVIGRIGNTGYTLGPTGCHLHFEVRGARNPF